MNKHPPKGVPFELIALEADEPRFIQECYQATWQKDETRGCESGL